MKQDKCINCKDRCADPNCHESCEYHKKKLEYFDKVRKAKKSEFEFYAFKHEAMRKVLKDKKK